VVCVVDDEELLPPHPTENAKASTTIGAASAGSRLRLRTHSQAEPRNINVHASDIGSSGKLTRGTAPVVTGAAVATWTVTGCVPLPGICTEELDRLHVGAGVTAGVIAQVRFIVPENDAVAAKATLKLAVCPVVIVWEVGEAAPIEKPGAGPLVLSSTPIPGPQKKTISGRPSLSMSAIG
jgi:hypothetical protein